MPAAQHAFAEELPDDFLLRWRVKADLAAAQAIFFIRKQRVQRHDAVRAGHVCRDVIRIGDADVRRGLGGDVGDHVVVDLAVIRIQAQIHFNIRIQRFKPLDGVLVDRHLRHVGVVLCPECDLMLLRPVEFLRDLEGLQPPGAVAARQREQAEHETHKQQRRALLAHPFVPPLATPAMIFCRKIRNSTISGTEMDTTAAIIAGMFSRPKPLSRMACMPLDTRK